MYYLLEPEVAGGFGENAEVDSSVHPPVVNALHLQFDGWLGDGLIECFPCFAVTEALKSLIQEYGFNGCSFANMEVTASDQFRELYPGRELPEFFWLKITGTPTIDDFAISDDHCLVVSGRAWDKLRSSRSVDNCDAVEYDG